MNDFSIQPLHSGVPPTGWLHSDWRPDPMVVFSAFALAALFVLWTGPLNRRRPGSENRPVTGRQTAYFLLGCLAYLIALGPPLDDWSDFYLQAAHMLQHMLVLFVVAPLLLVGTPAWVLQPLANNRIVNKIGWVLTRPLVAGVISSIIVIFWHVPEVYDAALKQTPLHVTQHGWFLIAGFLAWWPVLGPLPAWPRIEPPLLRCLYLFLYSLPASMLGAVITLSATGFYPFYDNVPRVFGIDLEMDQQLAGLMMWVGGSMVYLVWITFIFFNWASREEAADRAPTSANTAASPVEGA